MPDTENDLLQEGIQETQTEIFRDALAETPPADEPAVVEEGAAETPQEAGEQPRDAQGRFAPKDATSPPQAAPTQAQPGKPGAPPAPAEATQQDHRVPLRELLDERERRQELQRQLAHLQSQMQQAQRQQQPAEKPDFYADPDAYLSHTLNPLRQEIGSQIGEMREGFSRMMAIEKHGEETVSSAFAELERQMAVGQGQYDYARIMRSQHPFGELVRWHKNYQTQSKIGGDLDGFLKKREDELLNDPQFMQRVAEKLRAGNGSTPASGRSAGNVQLPPSLNKMTSAAPRTAGEDDLDVSDSGLFRHALS